jgi:hypothetical protein
MTYENYKLRQDVPVKVTTATTYLLRFQPAGWASYTVNDTTGEFSIISDYGNYSYAWYSTGTPTLSEFIATAHVGYMASKFAYTNKNLEDVIDQEETLKAFRKEICRLRRDRTLDEYEARDAWYALDEWRDADFNQHVCPSEIRDLFDNDYLEIADTIQMEASSEWEALTKLILPEFQKYLKENVLVKVEKHENAISA